MKKNKNKFRVILLMCLLLMAWQGNAQEVQIEGRVTDIENGEALPFVNISIKGAGGGTTTDTQGNYKIKATPGSILVFSFIGYLMEERVVGNSSRIDVALSPSVEKVDEVVVIGYGSVKKEDLTGSVDVISSKDFNKGAVTSPDQLFQGKIAGVRITNAGGQPDASPNIRIRGGASLTANSSPLIVIDGVPVDKEGIAGVSNPLSLINPNDIESFTVLKDASATAIYGSRASNGVLIITTKKGTSGDVQFNLSARTSLSKVGSNDQIQVMDSKSFVKFVQDFFPDDTGVLGVPIGSATTNEPVSETISTPDGERDIYNTDWQDVIFRTAITKDYTFSARAYLFNKIPIRASVGYNNTEGVVKKSDYERFTGALRLSPRFFDDHLKIDLNAKGSMVEKNAVDEGGALGGAVSMDPTKPIYDENSIFGGYYSKIRPADDPLNPNQRIGASNPLALLQQRDRPHKVNSLLANLELDYQFHFLPELRAVTNIGLETSKATIDETFAENAIATYTLVPDPNVPTGTYIFNPGKSYAERQTKTNTTWESYLAYKKEFESEFLESFDVQGGYSYQNFEKDGNKDQFKNDPVTGERIPNIDPENPTNRYFTLLNLQSFFGRSNINLGNKYLVTLSFRADASSFFTKENRWGYFPAAAVAWKVKEETFLEDVNFVNDFKIRFGWGETGQQDISGSVGFFPSVPLFEIGSPESQYIEGITLYNAKEFNPDLTWEKTTTYNFGVDFNFFKNSIISGSLDIFERKTTDLLVLTNVPPGQALSDRLIQNVGATDSKGFELNLNLNPIQTNNVALSLNGNLSYNITEVTDLHGLDQITTGSRLPTGTGNFIFAHALGEEAGSAWVLKQVYDTAGKPIYGAFVDRNDDGRITDDDRYYRAIQPNWTFGFGFTFNYKNWDLSSSFRGQFDGEIYNARKLTHGFALNALAQDGSSINNVLDFNAGKAEPGFSRIVDPVQFSDYYIESASFLRCENITLGYTLKDIIKNTILKIYTGVNNPFIITKYSGQDPENFSGIDTNFYPRPTVYNLGINLDF